MLPRENQVCVGVTKFNGWFMGSHRYWLWGTCHRSATMTLNERRRTFGTMVLAAG